MGRTPAQKGMLPVKRNHGDSFGGTTSRILAAWTWPVWISCRGPSYAIVVRMPHSVSARAVARVVRVHPSHSDSV
eukprot:4986127-Pleurochrysis_carterae.AAC.1